MSCKYVRVLCNTLYIFVPKILILQVPVKIIDDNKWEPDEEFFLRLTLVGKYSNKVKLGHFPIMEVTIMDDDGTSINY